LKRSEEKIQMQKLRIQDLHTEMTEKKSIAPMESRDNQISFLKSLFGDSVDFNLLSDFELTTKYATAYIFRNKRPKMKIAKFRKEYEAQYLE
jgi:hypothetical protein